jgi:hypothetical protein
MGAFGENDQVISVRLVVEMTKGSVCSSPRIGFGHILREPGIVSAVVVLLRKYLRGYLPGHGFV